MHKKGHIKCAKMHKNAYYRIESFRCQKYFCGKFKLSAESGCQGLISFQNVSEEGLPSGRILSSSGSSSILLSILASISSILLNSVMQTQSCGDWNLVHYNSEKFQISRDERDDGFSTLLPGFTSTTKVELLSFAHLFEDCNAIIASTRTDLCFH